MVSDGTELIDKVCAADGFTRREDGGAIILTSVEDDAQIKIRGTTKNGYMITKVGSQDPPITFGAQLGNGSKRVNVEARLARWGIEIRPDRLQKQARQARRQAADETSAASEQLPEATPTTTNQSPEVDMTKAADEILSDTSYSMDLITAAVLELARAADVPPVQERGVTVYDWSGDLYDVLRSLWPDLPVQPDADDLKRLYVQLIPEMRRTGALRKQISAPTARKGGKDVWRVRDDGRRAVAEPVVMTAPSPKEVPMSATTTPTLAPLVAASIPPEPATVPEETPAAVKLYPCPTTGCAFVDPVEHATQAHINKFNSRPEEHPVGVPGLPCPEGCGAVRLTTYAYRKHLVRDHPDKYKNSDVMCQKLDCLQWFDGTPKYRTHLKEVHPEALRRTHADEPTPVKEDAPPTAAVTPATPKPTKAKTVAVPAPAAIVNGAAPTGADETPAEAAFRMMTEYPAMKERLTYLEARNEELEHDIKEKDRALRSFKKKLDAFFE